MERIVLEVNEEVAKAWRNSPVQFRERVEKDLEFQIAEKIRQAERNNFFQLLDEVQQRAETKGLTPEKLANLLNDE
ncbi:hypothetical protein [Dyadobacter sp. MSC1_007]|jgi:hypothetical protein|uniref:hypothetical protein n=1 Tax=Dyadobacter sp. MSC1_007 TaxID=2909264 RepID=UPI00202EFC48|nr:hypothetical protein [Dyadobacter sp. MSC1_007]